MKKLIILISLILLIGCSKNYEDYCSCIEDGDYVQSEKFIESRIESDGLLIGLWLNNQPCVFEAYLIDKTDYSATHFVHFKEGAKKILHVDIENKIIISYIRFKE